MIFVDRSTVAPPKDLVAAGGIGEKENTRARAAFQGVLPGDKQSSVKFNFVAYKSVSVRAALETLFGSKCAYCESSYAEVQPMEIEHWRPKNAIAEDGKLTFPGYWWLAATWENLLPSCIDCNRERSHRINGRLTKAGKACKFPVAAGQRSTPDGSICESPLLLNPCHDQPSEFLEFRVDGTVIPKARPEGTDRATASIEVYGLIRPGLVKARGGLIKALLADMGIAATCLLELAQDQSSDFKRDLTSKALAKLESASTPSEKYACAVRQMVQEFRSDPFRFFDRVAAGEL